ncbi:MAG: helix-turn-helix domain-containing protein [Oceanospirillaceae bacterium]|nr:helix-turn-helix domain-containing protein [Oceanospirillaceae bacterium]NRB43126.1 helix-turn-helix domain-containing protein [Pseudomonadales bacterium]
MIINKVFWIGRAQYKPGASLGPRDTVGYEFVRILKGQVLYTYQHKRHAAPPGTWILSQPGKSEFYQWDKQGETQHDHIHFTLHALPKSFPALDEWPLIATLSTTNVMQALFQQIIDLHQNPHPQRNELIKLTVQQMLYYWVHKVHQHEDSAFGGIDPRLQKVMEMVLKRWRSGEVKPIPFAEMVALSNLSRSSFIRHFESEFSTSPSKFFEYQRLYLGRLYLLESNYSIQEISFRLQYNTPFHFSKNFKQLFHCSPRAFRTSPLPESEKTQNAYFQKIFNVLTATQFM